MKVFAVSYDPQDGLADFARTYGITYDLLSDSDSAVITRFGILNTLIDPTEPDAEVFYGIPFPGTYTVDASGIVVRKYFNQHLATRDAPERFLEEAGGQIVLSPDAPAGISRRRRSCLRLSPWGRSEDRVDPLTVLSARHSGRPAYLRRTSSQWFCGNAGDCQGSAWDTSRAAGVSSCHAAGDGGTGAGIACLGRDGRYWDPHYRDD